MSGVIFSVEADVLREKVDRAIGVVPTKDAIPALTHVQVRATDKGLWLASTDMALSVISEIADAFVEKTGTAILPARRLLEILRSVDGQVTFNVENGQARIRAGRTEWLLKLLPLSQFPKLPEPESLTYAKVPTALFTKALSVTSRAVPEDGFRPALAQVEVRNGKMRAADGLRFHQVPVEGVPDMRIPNFAIDELGKFLASTKAEYFEVGSDDYSLVFSASGSVFVSQISTLAYPDVEHLLLKPALVNNQRLVLDRRELAKAVKHARVTADTATQAVVLLLDHNEVVVVSKGLDGSWARESIDAAWEGGERSLSVNYVHLLDVLRLSESDQCVLMLGDPQKSRPSPILFRDPETEATAILTQLRIDYKI